MHQDRRRERRSARRAETVRTRHQDAPALTVAGADVVLVGYFSAKQKDFAALMDSAAAEMTARGARVVGRITQRRGVSGGGVKKMALPYSSRTLLSRGKAREAAEVCERTDADAAVFLTPLTSLTDHQVRVLATLFGCSVVSLGEILAADGLADGH
ncbi:hypothetical protein [Streptomyces sp. NBC_01615]|uniref:hypothetical protein n=1 Tax=Streptomyces sp. NBC_01615 TaxID=2975898 RepID=UPI00386B9AF9